MNDRIPGSGWYNPIWYGKYRIYLSDYNPEGYKYNFSHDDYDGSNCNDDRHGFAKSVEDAKKQIDEIEGIE
jgi:hypothetical protein